VKESKSKKSGSKANTSMQINMVNGNHRNRPDVINNIYNPNGVSLSQITHTSLGIQIKKKRKSNNKRHYMQQSALDQQVTPTILEGLE